jgi:hypothetical protein
MKSLKMDHEEPIENGYHKIFENGYGEDQCFRYYIELNSIVGLGH